MTTVIPVYSPEIELEYDAFIFWDQYGTEPEPVAAFEQLTLELEIA